MNAYELTKAVQKWKVERLGVMPTVEQCKMKFPQTDVEQLQKLYADMRWRHPQKGWIESKVEWS